MIYYLSQRLLDWSHATSWQDTLSFLRVFRYITFRRSAGAIITALLLCWWFGPKVIAWLKRLKFGQDYADKAEEVGNIETRIISKRGTPTMGGIMIVAVVAVGISDVPGDDPAVIGSGPTVPDPTTLADARAIVARYRLDVPRA